MLSRTVPTTRSTPALQFVSLRSSYRAVTRLPATCGALRLNRECEAVVDSTSARIRSLRQGLWASQGPAIQTAFSVCKASTPSASPRLRASTHCCTIVARSTWLAALGIAGVPTTSTSSAASPVAMKLSKLRLLVIVTFGPLPTAVGCTLAAGAAPRGRRSVGPNIRAHFYAVNRGMTGPEVECAGLLTCYARVVPDTADDSVLICFDLDILPVAGLAARCYACGARRRGH